MAATEPPLVISATARVCFTLQALLESTRHDRRAFMDYRPFTLTFDRGDGRASAEVQLGGTRVVCEVVASVVEPYPDRPLEGFLVFNVEVTGMASGGVEPGRNSAVSTDIARMLERQIRDARAIDTEALCILPGARVWAIRCDARVLEDDGNLTDAAALATMAALLHFRRADVTVSGDTVVVHSYSERSPLPLAVHHVPLCVTFGLFAVSSFAPLASAVASGGYPAPADGRPTAPPSPLLLLDPSKGEEEAGAGTATFVLNAHKELCGMHKLGGCPLPPHALVSCAKVASDKVAQLVGVLRSALSAAEVSSAEQARVKHRAASSGFLPLGTLDTAVLHAPHARLLGGGEGAPDVGGMEVEERGGASTQAV